jgi:hypothetical protein
MLRYGYLLLHLHQKQHLILRDDYLLLLLQTHVMLS